MLQNKELAIVLTLRVLPDDNAAETFAQTPVGEWSEEDKWFKDSKKVGYAGKIHRQFTNTMDHHDESSSICFKMKLKEIKMENAVPCHLNVLKDGEVFYRDFVPPSEVTVASLERGWDHITYHLEFEANPLEYF